MPTLRWWAGLAALGCALQPAALRAQVEGAASCSGAVYDESPAVAGAGPVERMHPLLSRARYADAVREGQWDTALRGLRDDAGEAFAAAGVPPATSAIFFAQLDSTIDALQRLPGPGDARRARFVADSVRSIRFLPVPAIDEYQLFRQPQIGLASLTPARQRALCWSAMSVDAVLFRLAKPLEGAALARLGRLTTAWANYRSYGYTRQPLELFLFPGSVHDSLPRASQWMVGHLSLGAELSGRIRDSLTSTGSTVLEFGWLRYRRNYTQYAGLSVIAGFASRESVGYGAMLHAARSLRGGVLLRRRRGHTRPSVIVSTDLYGLLERSKRSVDQGLAVARGIIVLPARDPEH